MAGNDVSKLQNELKRLDTVRQQLAEFFCEDLSSFKIEECFRIFHAFTCKFKQAVIENERRKFQEEQANARKRQREELLAAKRRQSMYEKHGHIAHLNLGNVSVENAADGGFIEMQIYDSGMGGGSKKVKYLRYFGVNFTKEDFLLRFLGLQAGNRQWNLRRWVFRHQFPVVTTP